MGKGGSLGGEKMKPVTGKSGIKSGGASYPNAKAVQGQNSSGGYAPMAKTSVPTGGKKK